MCFGLMNYTWRPTNTPDDQAFAGISAAIAGGATFLVSGEFYGTQDPQDNLRLLNRYFTAYPELASNVVLSVKGGVNLQKFLPDGSPDGIRRSINNILDKLDGKVRLDIFCIARVDRANDTEVTWRTVKEDFIDTGKIGGLCLSEVSADTIRRAVAITPIACLETEVSLWATEIYENGVADVCREHGIPIAAYSPLGRGFLTGQLKSPDDIPEGDMRRHFDRFKPENFPKNLELVEAVKKIAAKKGVTPSQLALAWVVQYGAKRGLAVIPIFGATKEEQVVENLKATEVHLTDEDFAEIDALLKSFKPVGGRYNAAHEAALFARHVDLQNHNLLPNQRLRPDKQRRPIRQRDPIPPTQLPTASRHPRLLQPAHILPIRSIHHPLPVERGAHLVEQNEVDVAGLLALEHVLQRLGVRYDHVQLAFGGCGHAAVGGVAGFVLEAEERDEELAEGGGDLDAVVDCSGCHVCGFFADVFEEPFSARGVAGGRGLYMREVVGCVLFFWLRSSPACSSTLSPTRSSSPYSQLPQMSRFNIEYMIYWKKLCRFALHCSVISSRVPFGILAVGSTGMKSRSLKYCIRRRALRTLGLTSAALISIGDRSSGTRYLRTQCSTLAKRRVVPVGREGWDCDEGEVVRVVFGADCVFAVFLLFFEGLATEGFEDLFDLRVDEREPAGGLALVVFQGPFLEGEVAGVVGWEGEALGGWDYVVEDAAVAVDSFGRFVAVWKGTETIIGKRAVSDVDGCLSVVFGIPLLLRGDCGAGLLLGVVQVVFEADDAVDELAFREFAFVPAGELLQLGEAVEEVGFVEGLELGAGFDLVL
ncbi:hypothetical protein Dda_5913 [Drechslerella dactyloides]|uniref:NADP-dependent oxidoreductase domain-containing protein n=1 Tax=Drechslerella dactyloides TaxID=74499 RepID=A0AAD6IZ09_DREDA|nr:hypothetical protein Dda_5913 [Drechslerella dactyloides]